MSSILGHAPPQMTAAIRIPLVTGASLRAALAGLTALNEWALSTWDVPPIYSAGVRYQREPAGREDWDIAPIVYARGWGDCEDLAAWRAAELRLGLGGVPPERAIADTYQSGPRTWHCIVRRADGSIEDPSLMLGMRPTRWDLPPGWRYADAHFVDRGA
jgi:hypothetical protein